MIDRITMLKALVKLVQAGGGTFSLNDGQTEDVDGCEVLHSDLIEGLSDSLAVMQMDVDFGLWVRWGDDGRAQAVSMKGYRFSPSTAQVFQQYVLPGFYPKLLLNFQCARDWKTRRSRNVMFYGQKGTGKTTCSEHLVEDAGFGRLFHQNGTAEMGVDDFLGVRTISIDEKTGQNHVTFKKGALYEAMIYGTELDADGNQVLVDGQPVVIGPPALYFLDEYQAVDPRTFLSVFNRAMEVPGRPGEGRSLEIPQDGGRSVKSHPGFAMILGGNLLGKGIEDDSQAGYTAQNNQHDDSTLDRIDAVYEFGYSLKAEKGYILRAVQDDSMAEKVIGFIHNMREQWEKGIVDTLLSTRSIISFCEQMRTYRDAGYPDWMLQSFCDSIYGFLRFRERNAWDKSFEIVFGESPERSRSASSDFYIPRRRAVISI